MTREEVINILYGIRADNLNLDDAYTKNKYNALDVAIKALEQEPKYTETIDFAIDASGGDTNYFVGFRNGLRYAKSLIDGEEPQFESCVDQEPCEDANYNSIKTELNGGMISRQAVCKIIDDIRDCISVEGYWAFLERLKKLPPVNPQPKTGHWIKKDGYSDCSECGSHIVTEWDYCPKCGAKMIEPQESEVRNEQTS